MKLLLTSEGITNQSIANALLKLLGKPFERSRAVHIPTAANGETGDKSWIQKQAEGIRKLGFSSVEVMDISIVSKKQWFPVFEKADMLSFGGGSVEYLLIWMEKSGLKKVIPDLLETRMYMGISAGSMAAAKTVSLSSSGIIYYEKIGKFENINGLGLVDFEIRPHLNDSYFTKCNLEYLGKLAQKSNVPFYALDDNSAVVVDGDSVSVVSEGEWKKFN